MKKLTCLPDILAPSSPSLQKIDKGLNPSLRTTYCCMLIDDQGQDRDVQIFLDFRQYCLRYQFWHAGEWENMDHSINTIFRKEDGLPH